jgi:hypothetical protein
MMTKDGAAVMRAVATVVREYFAVAVSGLETRLKAIESRELKDGAPGPQGPQGEPGRDGKDADLGTVTELQAQIAALRVQIDAEREARESAPPPDVQAIVAEEVAKAVAALPEPVSVADVLVNRDGHLVTTLTNGATKEIGPVVGRDGKDADPDVIRALVVEEVAKIPKPKDGAPGKDGTLEHVKGVYGEDGRYRFVRKEDGAPLDWDPIPVLRYRELWEASKTYEPGEVTTWGGSMWIAREATSGVPPDESTPAGKKSWALCVMRGRQGKTGPQGAPGLIGKQGPKGDPGPRIY